MVLEEQPLLSLLPSPPSHHLSNPEAADRRVRPRPPPALKPIGRGARAQRSEGRQAPGLEEGFRQLPVCTNCLCPSP